MKFYGDMQIDVVVRLMTMESNPFDALRQCNTIFRLNREKTTTISVLPLDIR